MQNLSDFSEAMLTFSFWSSGDRIYQLASLNRARVKAEPPTPPKAFNTIVEGKRFTNGKDDLPFVQNKYEETLRAILGNTERLDFRGSTWSAEARAVPLCALILACPTGAAL